MTNIGAEVGQKMRSAIKAKLLELNCYVDDELPDYVMVMVANKRTKSQMKEDLQLFLSNKTGAFVDWLHIVLKKLKEVTVTNPDIIKKNVKRKADDITDIDVKKEKKPKKLEKKVATKVEPPDQADDLFKSLTDDLPISANKLSEQRKIIVLRDKPGSTEVDNFDIPPLSEVNMSTEEELEDLEKKIKSVKSRLGLLVESDDDDCINLKTEPDELFNSVNSVEQEVKAPEPKSPTLKKPERTRITFTQNDSWPKKKSVLERLGKRRVRSPENDKLPIKRIRSGLSSSKLGREQDKNDVRDKPKSGVLSRLGVMSKVSVPAKQAEEPEEPFKNREVPSMVKIKPRIIPSDTPQANKKLLLKAVAEAQRSVAQTPPVGNTLKADALYTKKYKEKVEGGKKIPVAELTKIRKILSCDGDKNEVEYVPTPITKSKACRQTEYVPTPKIDVENGSLKQKFIVTLDGIEKTKFKDLEDKVDVKNRLDQRRTPSPIVFDKVASPAKTKVSIPDKLPIVHASHSVKNKERCKYWPSCKHGEKCEFVHPSLNCDKFPHCKFGDKCLYLHPNCKFGSSCTRRDCPYSHNPQLGNKALTSSPVKPTTNLQTCKFFPNCTNISCPFYHPRPCKFGKYCKNPKECNFVHAFSKSNLTWKK